MDSHQVVPLAYWRAEQTPLECRDKVGMEAQMCFQKFNTVMGEVPVIMHSCKDLPRVS